MGNDSGRFGRGDVPTSLLFVGLGLLVLAFVVLSFVRGSLVASALVYVLGGVLGILLLFIGANGLVRSLRARPGDRKGGDRGA